MTSLPWQQHQTRYYSSQRVDIPKQSDVVIIGGGAMGMSTAFWLRRTDPSISVTVIERDPTYSRASSPRSVGGIRQQFSLPENIHMSLFAAHFIQNTEEYLTVPNQDPPDVQYYPVGYLFLASNEEEANLLQQNHKVQVSFGAKVELLGKEGLKKKFPWMETDDLELGSYGIQNEGWFDPWVLVLCMRAKATHLGAKVIKGDVVGFNSEGGVLSEVLVKNDDGNVHPIRMTKCVNCGGAWAGKVGEMAGIGSGSGIMSVPLPIEPRKRYIHVVHCPDGPGMATPIVIDPSYAFIRREGTGGNYLVGVSPKDESEEPKSLEMEVEHGWFEERVWPRIAHRVKAFECCKLKSEWAGYYDFNYLDENLIIGKHPQHHNFYMAIGSSGHGIQHSPSIGRAMMELILEDRFETIDLTRFGFDRVVRNEPLREQCIV